MKPSFDSWTIIFLLIAFHGVITAIGFAIGRGARSGGRFISYILLAFSLTLVGYVLFWTGYWKYFPFMNLVIAITPLLFGPLFYFYLQKIIHYPAVRSTGYFWHLLPALIFLTYHILISQILTAEERGIFFNQLFHRFIPWLKIAHLIIYGILCYRMIANATLLSEMNKWANYIVLFYIGFVISFTSYYILVNFSFFNLKWDYAISFSMSAFICFVAIFAYIQPQIFNGHSLDEVREIFSSSKYKTTGLTSSAAEELFSSLQTLMANRKLYRENDLRLDRLARELNSTRHHVSQVINEKTGGNFSDYINSLRINEARSLLSMHQKSELNIIEIAYMVGFNNKVSFNTTFKKITGFTPTEYRLNSLRADNN